MALARALVIELGNPSIDEPLSNLDAHLSHGATQRNPGAAEAAGYLDDPVTHDQQGAARGFKRTAVMSAGRLVDVGTPEALCDRPGNPFAAAFLGARTVISGRTRDGVFARQVSHIKARPKAYNANIVLRGRAPPRKCERTALDEWQNRDASLPGRLF